MPVTPNKLAKREQDVPHLLVQGLGNKAMALSLALSEKIIEFHLKNLLAKLQVNSRVEAALWAKAHSLISDSSADSADKP